MITKILPDLYKIEVPLPQNPLKYLNSYIFKTEKHNLIIDTGMNREECLNSMYSGLRELEVDLRETDFFLTHLHADHTGLVSTLKTDRSKIYCSQADAETLVSSISSNQYWEKMRAGACLHGFPENEAIEAIEKHPGYKYSSKGKLEFHLVNEGYTIAIGGYKFYCVATPGHTKGHMCLYEPNKKLLVSGDHIISNITPNISLWDDQENVLEIYLKSLDKIFEFEIESVLPGHRDCFSNCKQRIQELRDHHRIRAHEVLKILEKGNLNAYQVASRMSWDISYKYWDLFPVSQKWFATGEAIAHLKYLEEKQLIKREMKKQQVVFAINKLINPS